MTLLELSKKDVVQQVTGENLGRIDDLDFDPATAALRAVILYGRPRLFGLLGRGPDAAIPWEQIKCVGTDVVMTDAKLDASFLPHKHKRMFWQM